MGHRGRASSRSRSASRRRGPENIVSIDEVELEHWGDKGVTAPLATRERSDLAGFHWERLNPGKTGAVPHCHSAEEEIFVILEGAATLHLWPSPLRAERGAEREQHELRPGHVVARPPGSGVSHWFQAGDDGVTMLIYGTRDTERHVLVSALEQDLVARARGDRADRGPRVRRRRARRLGGDR